ncbi:MAG: hypothetical protein NT179_05605 [Nitrospirae bacterium]|nr:hypothetical protein [Nitrospirota bacterium]
MPQELSLVGASIRADVQLNELPRFLAEQSPDLPVYEWRPRPGVIAGAAFDWVAVLGITADLIEVGGMLWAAYEHLIKKRKKVTDVKQAAFLIQVKTRSGTFVQFTIEDGQQREIFIQEFTHVVSSLRESSDSPSTESLIEVLESSETLARVKLRGGS